jgi:carbamoylphosphate synthase large subunit
MKPAILLVTSCRWFATARIAIAFAEAGCDVDIVCLSSHPVAKTSVTRQIFTYHGLRPLPGLQRAIEKSNPSLLVPCDDRATTDLIKLAAQTSSGAVRECIQNALGAAENYIALTARNAFMRLARGEGICVPETAKLDDFPLLHSWLATHGLPAYLKADGTSGGVGVMKVRNSVEAEQAFALLSAPPAAIRVVKRLLVDQDTSFVLPFARRVRPTVNAQKAILGIETNSAVSCWKGELLACLHAEVLERRDAAGHATVIRVIENQQMQEAAEKIARRLDLSGIFGLDYIVERDTGLAYLIEMNVRATQTCHLALGPGKSPIACLAAAMSKRSLDDIPSVTNADTIALFPQEWKRSPASPYLEDSFHDVPWSYPELVRTAVKSRIQDQDSFSYKKWLQRRGSVKAELFKE